MTPVKARAEAAALGVRIDREHRMVLVPPEATGSLPEIERMAQRWRLQVQLVLV